MLSWVLLNLVIGKEYSSATKLTALVLEQPDMWVSATWQPYTPWLHWSLVIASTQEPFQQTLTQQPSRWLWGWLTTTGQLALRLGWDCLGTFIIGYARSPSLQQWILGFALSEAMGLFFLVMVSHPCWHVKQLSPPPPPMVLSPMSHLPYVFFWGNSGESVWLRLWQRKTKYCINKKNST